MKTLQKIFLLQILFFLNPITLLQASDSDPDGEGEKYCDSNTFDGASVNTLGSNRKLKKYPWTHLHRAINRTDIKEVIKIVSDQNFKPHVKKYYRGETPLDLAIKGSLNKNYHLNTREKYKEIITILQNNNVQHANLY